MTSVVIICKGNEVLPRYRPKLLIKLMTSANFAESLAFFIKRGGKILLSLQKINLFIV